MEDSKKIRGRKRAVYNHLLKLFTDEYARTKRIEHGDFQSIKDLLREELEWIDEMDTDVIIDIIKEVYLDLLKIFYKDGTFPDFKRKKDDPFSFMIIR